MFKEQLYVGNVVRYINTRTKTYNHCIISKVLSPLSVFIEGISFDGLTLTLSRAESVHTSMGNLVVVEKLANNMNEYLSFYKKGYKC